MYGFRRHRVLGHDLAHDKPGYDSRRNVLGICADRWRDWCAVQESPSRNHRRTGAGGPITEARQANEIVTGDNANLVSLARELLRVPYWALKAQQ